MMPWQLELIYVVTKGTDLCPIKRDSFFSSSSFVFIMWDCVHTEGMRQRGTLRPLNKLALPILVMVKENAMTS